VTDEREFEARALSELGVVLGAGVVLVLIVLGVVLVLL
jgi:hypothetical protein